MRRGGGTGAAGPRASGRRVTPVAAAGVPRRRPAWVRPCLLLSAAAGSGCELEQITVVDVEDVPIAEVYVEIDPAAGAPDVLALLHRTVGHPGDTVRFSGARITLSRDDGLVLELDEAPIDNCGDSVLDDGSATCFEADPEQTPALRPGDVLEVEILLPGGGMLSGATRVPGTFALQGVEQGQGATCRLPADTHMEVRWTRSDGAWAYVNETSIHDLPAALAREGIEMDDDPLYLLGLSVSADDTTIVFPREFGLFNRFELDQDVALRLQVGLPAETLAEITITAVDRNYVNWARGGSFNPSGQVRVPSLRGDGTGVFASTVVRRVVATVGPQGSVPAPCPFLDPD